MRPKEEAVIRSSIVAVAQRDETQWYFVCARCNAKWFAPTQRCKCPRCLQTTVSGERLLPPWRRKLAR
jgi:hypothetical protein